VRGLAGELRDEKYLIRCNVCDAPDRDTQEQLQIKGWALSCIGDIARVTNLERVRSDIALRPLRLTLPCIQTSTLSFSGPFA